MARQQAFEFAPVMKALQDLAALKDWSHDFLVAYDLKLRGLPERAWFSWRNARTRRYESFDDFYRRELEETWGSWAKLQTTYADMVSNKITEEDRSQSYDANQQEPVKRKRGRPKGSKNRPKPAAIVSQQEQVKRKRGRPKGSRNKPKLEEHHKTVAASPVAGTRSM